MDGWKFRPEGWENVETQYDIDDYKVDIIIVLAGGLDEKGKVHEWVKRRLNRAIELHKLYNVPILCCGGGTYHKPPFLNKKSFVIHEATECANYLIQNSVNPDEILKEWSSYDTIANAFFSLTNHVLCNDWTHISVVTSEFHIERSKAIFDWIYNIFSDKYIITYESVNDIGLNKNLIESRKDREKRSLNNVLLLRENIKTVKDFHKWFYTEHNAYNNRPNKEEIIDKDCVKSY